MQKGRDQGLDEGANEIKELLTLGTLKHTSRQIVYDAIPTASPDGLDEKEEAAIRKVTGVLGISYEELEKILRFE